MVKNHIVAAAADSHRVLLLSGAGAGPAAEIAHDDIVSAHFKTIVAETDAVAGRGLTGDSQIGVSDPDSLLQVDDAGHPKDHNARSLGIASFAEAAGPGVVEIGDGNDFAVAATRS